MVNGSLNAQASAVTVNTTATLGGTGTINRPTTVNGILSPGDGGPGTLAIGSDLTFAANSSMVFDLNVPAHPTWSK